MEYNWETSFETSEQTMLHIFTYFQVLVDFKNGKILIYKIGKLNSTIDLREKVVTLGYYQDLLLSIAMKDEKLKNDLSWT